MSDDASIYVPVTPATPERLDRLVRFVVETVQPLRVVLFGSAARGDLGPHSDVDLLVVMPDGADRREVFDRLVMARLEQDEPFGFPIDFVVTTASHFEAKKDVPWFVHYDVNLEGRTLYAA